MLGCVVKMGLVEANVTSIGWGSVKLGYLSIVVALWLAWFRYWGCHKTYMQN